MMHINNNTHRRLDVLSTNGQNRQWTADKDIDWKLDIIRPNWLLRRFHGALISQFRHGELITVQICKHLLEQVTDPFVRNLLIQQISDEERHTEVYERYLIRLGNITEIDPAMAESVERMYHWQGSYLGLMVAVHIILEGEALRTLQDLSKEIPCPLFSQINSHITRDEARHVAFGKVYLKEHLRNLHPDERMEIYQFVRSLWLESTKDILADFKIAGFITQALRRRWVDDGWTVHSRALIDIGLVNAEDMARV